MKPDTISRIAKMLPRIGSDAAGEVLATAAAISRTLTAAGKYWNDLAAELAPTVAPTPEFPDRYSRSRAPSSAVTRWSTMGFWQRHSALRMLAAAPDLSGWEAEFVSDITERFTRRPDVPLSSKQIGRLDQLLARHLRWSAAA